MVEGQAAIVDILGPLEHHQGDGFCDSYESILARVSEACESDAASVVLRVDSPGGLVSGCFPTANAIRAKCDAAGKKLLAYVTGSAGSAAYALICQADKIAIGPGCAVGSVGIIDARIDATKQDAAFGLRYAFITSGERKADGNPHMPMSDEELAERQASVNTLADVFFDMVAQRRPITAAQVKSLQARVFIGQAAIENGLADLVGTFEGLLALASEPKALTQASERESIMSAARKALEEAAKGDGDEAKAAKRALAAWDEEEPKGKAEDEGEGDDKEKEEPKGEEETEEEKKKKEDEARALAASASASATIQSPELKAIEDEQRRAFLDTRPDLTAAQVASVQGLPMANVRAVVNAIPRAPKVRHAATATATGTRAEGQGGVGNQRPVETDPELLRIDAAMGLVPKAESKCELRGTTFYLGGAPAPEKA